MGDQPTLRDQAADLIEQLRTHREMIRLPASGPYHGSPFSVPCSARNWRESDQLER